MEPSRFRALQAANPSRCQPACPGWVIDHPTGNPQKCDECWSVYAPPDRADDNDVRTLLAMEAISVHRSSMNAWNQLHANAFQGQPIVRCSGCGVWRRDCQRLWSQQKKCCPDCDHPVTYPRNLNPMELEPYYSKHVADMSAEGLHAKSDIALQLAWRDQQIVELKARLAAVTGNEEGSICRLPTFRTDSPVRQVIGWCPRCHVKSARFIDGQCQECGEPSK